MQKVLALLLFINIGIQAGDEGILPRQLTVDLLKKCSKTMFSTASYGSKVENMGCIRNITQKTLLSCL